MKKNLPFLLLIPFIILVQTIHAQNIGDYRSVKSGKWSDVSVWQVFGAINWQDAVVPPSDTSGVITISSGDSVAVTSATPADQLYVSTSAVLSVQTPFFYLNDGPGTDLTVKGRVEIAVGADMESDSVTGACTVDYQGDTVVQNGGFSPIITFSGTKKQTVIGYGYFGTVNLQNANGIVVTNMPSFSQLNFITGKVYVTGALVVGIYTTFTGQGANSFIDGPIECIVVGGNNAFTLPVGKGDSYLPESFSIKVDTSQKSEYAIISTIQDSAAPTQTLPASLDKVSKVRYYNLSNPGNIKIDSGWLQLSYDGTDGVTDPENLRIAKSDTIGNTHNWVNLGGTGSAVTNGTITTTVNFTALGNFALANATGGSNTLPLHFISFTAAAQKQAVALNWATANEVNTNYFNVERSDAASNWKTVGSVNANKNSTANSYAFTDATVSSAGSYVYRIKEIDKDGSFYFSSEVLVHMQGTGKMDVTSLYPNPARDVLNYYVSAGGNNNVTIAITGTDGKLLGLQHATTNQPLQIGIQNLSGGTYFLTFTNESTGEKVVKKVVKM